MSVLRLGLWRQWRFLFCAGWPTHGADDCRTVVQGAGSADFHLTASGTSVFAVSTARSAYAISLVSSARRSRLRSGCVTQANDSQSRGYEQLHLLLIWPFVDVDPREKIFDCH